MSDVVSIHRHFTRVDKFVLSDHSHICRDGTYLFASNVVVELCRCVAWSCSILYSLIRTNGVVSEHGYLLTTCRLIAREFTLMVSSSTLALTSSVIHTICVRLIVPLVRCLGQLLVDLRVCFSFVVIVLAILIPVDSKTSSSLPWLRLIVKVLILECLSTVLNLGYWTFTTFTAKIILASNIIHIVVVHNVYSSISLSWPRFLVFTATSLRISSLFFFNDELLPWVSIYLLCKQMRLLLLINLSKMLLLGFVLF